MTVSQLKSDLLIKFEKQRLEIIYPVYSIYDFVKSIDSLLSNFKSVNKTKPWYRLLIINDGLKKEVETKLESYITYLKANKIPVKYLRSHSPPNKATSLEFGMTKSLSNNVMFIEKCCKFDKLNLFLEKCVDDKGKTKLTVFRTETDGSPDFIFFRLNDYKYLNRIITSLRKGSRPESRGNIVIETVSPKRVIPKIIVPDVIVPDVIKENPMEMGVNIPLKGEPFKELPVAIMMTVWGRYDLTKKTIESLHENTEYPFKLVVIDDKSNKKVINLLKEFEEKKMIDKLILREERSTGTAGTQALNDGLKFIRENWLQEIGYIANQDNDFEFHNPYWLRACVDAIEKLQGYKKYKVGAVSVHAENEQVHKTIETIDMKAYSINVKEVIGGGQYLYKKEHFDDLTGGMYYTDTEWQLWKKHLTQGFHVGNITKYISVFTFNWIEHTGAGKRCWDKKRCPA